MPKILTQLLREKNIKRDRERKRDRDRERDLRLIINQVFALNVTIPELQALLNVSRSGVDPTKL